jgi:hypothetical protein
MDWDEVTNRMQQRMHQQQQQMLVINEHNTTSTIQTSNIPIILPSIEDCQRRWKVLNPESKVYPAWTNEEVRLADCVQSSTTTITLLVIL